MDLLKASFKQISDAVKSKKLSAVEVSKYFFENAQAKDKKLNSYISWNENVLVDAEALDQRIAQGEDIGKLAGVPFGIKDMFCTKGLRTTAASKILENFIPPYDSTVVSRLKKSGITILGKLNQDEFAMGSSNETSFFGTVKNPWNLEYVPGGSSGGSAAAQAARLAAGTLGTDTGGSIRQPSSFCGIVGIKPTYGRVSRYGIVSFASSLDQAGPMVSCVEDAALTLEVICGKDEKDSTTADQPVAEFSKHLNESIKGKKIGLVKEYMTETLHPDIQNVINKSIEVLKQAGAEFVDLSVPMADQAVALYYLISASEASSNLARYDGVKYGYRSPTDNLASLSLEEFYMKNRGEGFGREVKRRIMLGTYCLSSGYYDAYYNKACQVRRLLRDHYVEVFKKCDAILCPVTTSPAFKIGSKVSDPLAMYLNDIFTVSANLSGLPGMSVPFGKSKEGLPIGVQLLAGHFQEQTLLQIAYTLEQASTERWAVANV